MSLRDFLVEEFGSTQKYWKLRVKKYGKASVINLIHPFEEYSKVTDIQKKEIYPIFKNLLNGNEFYLLDFGCGPGRFTVDLAEMINGRALGVDIIQQLLELAPKSEIVDYKLFTKGKIPLNDNTVDIVWICLVLGGIKEKMLEKVIKEINRVSKSRSLIFLVENTTLKPNGKHWFFRSFQDYKKLLPYFDLKYLHEYYDLGERISIMGGRKIV